MELALVIWFIGALNSIVSMFGWFMFLSAVFIALSCIMFVASHDGSIKNEQDKLYWRAKGSFGLKFFITSFILCSILYTVTPSTKTGWMMAGGYVAQTAIQSDTAKKFALVIENKMQEVLDEATEQAKIKAKSINKETEKKD